MNDLSRIFRSEGGAEVRPQDCMHFCVYVLMRPDTGAPFYVGKGTPKRPWAHLRKKKQDNPEKRRIIDEYLAQGVDVPVVIIHSGLSENVAYEYEEALILAIGRQPHGPLVNMTNGGHGSNGHRPTDQQKLQAAKDLAFARARHDSTLTLHTGKRHFIEGSENLRRFIEGNETWFVATDVCELLGLKHPTAVAKRLDDDEKCHRIIASDRGKRMHLFISAPGLYSLAMRTRKPSARAFFNDVVTKHLDGLWPDFLSILQGGSPRPIRRTGSYSIPERLAQETLDLDNRAAWRRLSGEMKDAWMMRRGLKRARRTVQ